MNFKSLLVLCVLMTSSYQSIQGLCRIAQEKDIPALLGLIKIAEADKDKIVILPEKFRQGSLENAIAQQRLFVAEEKDTVVGYKKLFLIEEPQEKMEIMFDELKMGEHAVYIGTIDKSGKFLKTDATLPIDTYDCCIYNGADFTAPDYIGKGINSELTAFALRTLEDNVSRCIESKKPRSINMLYGITHDNAGEKPGVHPDRTIGISKLFRAFVGSVTKGHPEKPLFHMRHKAAKPSFDLEDLSAEEPQQLPEKDSIPGFGCLLSYYLGDS